MEGAVPWSRLYAVIEPHYPKGSAAAGRLPLPSERMFRIYCLQQWYRAVVEHPFLVVKRLWNHASVRCCGIAKNPAQMNALFAPANLYRVRYPLLSP